LLRLYTHQLASAAAVSVIFGLTLLSRLIIIATAFTNWVIDRFGHRTVYLEENVEPSIWP